MQWSLVAQAEDLGDDLGGQYLVVALQREHRIFDGRLGPAAHFGD